MSAVAAEAETDPIKRAQRIASKRGLAVSNELRKSARALRATSARPAPLRAGMMPGIRAAGMSRAGSGGPNSAR